VSACPAGQARAARCLRFASVNPLPPASEIPPPRRYFAIFEPYLRDGNRTRAESRVHLGGSCTYTLTDQRVLALTNQANDREICI